MPIPSPLPLSIPVLLFVVSISIRPPVVSSGDLSVLSHPSKLQLPLGQPVDSSPGSRPGAVMTCNRAHIHGLSRLHHPTKFAHSLKVRISVSQGDAIFRIQTIELCFHRNASLGVGMCPAAEWQKLSKNSWVRSMSPYGHWILDIRMLQDPSRSIELSTEHEFLFHHVVFLLLGMAMMITANAVSEAVVFYYGSAMPVSNSIVLVIPMVLSQVGVATFLLHYLPELLCSMLVVMNISEAIHNPLGSFLLACLGLAGAWFSYWGVRKLVLTEDRLVDFSLAYFLKCAVMIFSAAIILQSSMDTLLAAEALSFAIMISTITRMHAKLRFLHPLFKRVKHVIRTLVRSSSCDYFRNYSHAWYPLHPNHPGSESTRHQTEQENYYSTFHMTAERTRFSKERWESFTREQSREAMRELLSSPEFHEWAVANTERIMVTPPGRRGHLKKGDRHGIGGSGGFKHKLSVNAK